MFFPRSQAADEAGSDTGTSKGTGTVLLVEDNPEVAEVTLELLTDMGCDTETVRSAEEALGALAEGRFDLVLSDIVMAGSMNGLDLARAIREQRPELRVVLATGYSDAAVPAAQEFTLLRKPYAMADLDWAFTSQGTGNVVDLDGTNRGRAAKGGGP